MFHFLGLFLMILTWMVGLYLIRKWRNKSLLTISKHASSTVWSYLLFALSLSAIGISLYIWLLRWFMPHLKLNALFGSILTLMIICLVVTAVIPDTKGLSRRLHRIAAFSMAVLYLPLSLLIALSATLHVITRILCLGLLIYMLLTFTFVVLMKRSQQRYLVFQGLYIVAFQLIVLSAAYM